MRKSKFNLTHLSSTTLDPGYLVPFLLQPTLPNDTYRIGLSTFIRAQPMLAPLMHEVYFYTQYWFCPYRILWDSWEEFITGGNDLSFSPAFPTIKAKAEDIKTGSLWDYFGFPLVEGVEVSAMPFRAMAEIYNTRYRDEDLQGEILISYEDGDDDTTSRSLLSPSFAKDYFTLARPYTQRGGDIAVPVFNGQGGTGTTRYKHISYKLLFGYTEADPLKNVGGILKACSTNQASIQTAISNWFSANVDKLESLVLPLPPFADSVQGRSFFTEEVMNPRLIQLPAMTYTRTDTQVDFPIIPKLWIFIESITEEETNQAITSSFVGDGGVSINSTCPNRITVMNNSSPNLAIYTYPFGLVAWFGSQITASSTYSAQWEHSASSGSYHLVTSAPSTAGFYIRDLRRSAALQRYAERSLKYGNRYEEFIQREFGIKPRDARIQRPEYLGGGRGILNISEVLQTAEAQDTGVGTMRGHGVGSIHQRSIRFTCPEHGLILGLVSIRPKSVYTQGIDREWLKRSRLDFFTPELASIGMQEVLTQELFATADNAGEIFGYSDRYQEYRYKKPMVTGEFRGNLSFWNMARIFQNAPALNGEFISMANAVSDFKRPFQIQDGSAHAFVMMLKNHLRCYRPIPKKAKDVLK